MLEETEGVGAAYNQSSTTTSLKHMSHSEKEVANQIKMRMMIDAYRNLGHQFAKVDPLNLPLNSNRVGRLEADTLHISQFGFTPE